MSLQYLSNAGPVTSIGLANSLWALSCYCLECLHTAWSTV